MSSPEERLKAVEAKVGEWPDVPDRIRQLEEAVVHINEWLIGTVPADAPIPEALAKLQELSAQMFLRLRPPSQD